MKNNNIIKNIIAKLEIFISNLIWIFPLMVLTIGEYYVQRFKQSHTKG